MRMTMTTISWDNIIACKVDCMSPGDFEVGTLIFRYRDVERLLIIL